MIGILDYPLHHHKRLASITYRSLRRMRPTISSPEEEVEEVEEAIPAGRVPLPSSVTKDLLRASAPRSSRGGTSMTPTPASVVARETRKTATNGISTVDRKGTSSSARFQSGQSSSSRADRHQRRIVGEGGYEDAREPISIDSDSDDSLMLTALPRAGPSRLAHGPRQETSESLVSDARALSSNSSSLHHSPPKSIAKYKGAPYVEVPYRPLNTLRRYTKPLTTRHPTTLSRHHQTYFAQTPPPSSGDSDFSLEELEPDRPQRSTRSDIPRKLPSWRTRTNSASSPDLGGYGTDPSSEDEQEEEGSEDSDIRVLGSRRSTRAKAKGKQAVVGRTTKAHKQVSLIMCVCVGRAAYEMRGDSLSEKRSPFFSFCSIAI